MFNSTFRALLGETEFTKEILCSGVTQIRHANYTRKGRYFQAFTALSTGLERLGKICLMLDYHIDNRGQFPDITYMRRTIGHDIELLLSRTTEVCEKRNLSLQFGIPSWEPEHEAIIKILSGFAKGDRYSYLDALVDGGRPSDPVAAWFKCVDKPLFERHVTDGEKRKIRENAHVIAQMMAPYAAVVHTAESGAEVANIEEASWLTGMQEAAASYRQLYTLQVIRFWVDAIFELQFEAMKVESATPSIPYMSEVLGAFYNRDSELRAIKDWESL